MIKLVLATLLVLAIYSLYKHIKGRGESQSVGRASNERNRFDDKQAVEAEYRVIDEGEEKEEKGHG